MQAHTQTPYAQYLLFMLPITILVLYIQLSIKQVLRVHQDEDNKNF